MRFVLRAVLCRCLPLGILAIVWVVAHRDASIDSPLDPEWYITADGVVGRRSTMIAKPPAAPAMAAPADASEADEVAAAGRREAAGQRPS